jgi:Fe-S oxidoreductase
MGALHRTGLEMSVLATLLAISALLFAGPMKRVLATILGSKPDSDFRWAPLGRRVADFLWKVVCQAQVIRERPIAGLAHAFVFWGFCAFSVVTINHVAMGFGGRWIDPQKGVFGPVYFAVAALFAGAVAFSISVLAMRRFVLRPKWLGEQLSLGSGLVALLILILMGTYLADYRLGLDPASGAGRLVWWIHTAALLTFLPVIVRTKHLHLLLAPVTVFLSRGGFSRIPPLVGEEDFGLVTGADATRLLALQAFSCVECGRCQEHCPAYNTGKILNPKEIALGLRSYLKAYGAGADKPLLGEYLSEEAIFQCTTCGACEFQCPVGIEHLPLLVGLRRGAVNTGQWEDAYGGELFLRLERTGNPLGMSALERDKFIRKAELPLYDGTQEYLLWLGCMGAYDPAGRETVLALTRVMRYLGVSCGVLKKEKCTGDAARRLGNDLAFQQLAEFNIGQLKAVQARKLISICPHCVRTIGEDWQQAGASFEIEHHSVFLARHDAKLPAPGERERAVYHDPCYLGRYLGTYDEPRAVVAGAAEPIEVARRRERSFCCGAGGGLAFLGAEKGTRVSHERAVELAATEAEMVAAACPFCHTMLRDALAAVRPFDGPQIVDIAQLAAARLPRTPGARTGDSK